MVPELLTPEHKESRITIHADILNNIDTAPGLLDTVTLKGTRFESVEAVKAKATGVLNQLTEADFQHHFQQWKSRMERFCFRLGHSVMDTFAKLQPARVFSRAQVFRWFKAFSEGRESIEGEPRSEKPLSSRNDENVDRIRDLLRSDHWLTTRITGE
ncbi:hypothetical protein NQ318_003628, partial [Aromia moschata]